MFTVLIFGFAFALCFFLPSLCDTFCVVHPTKSIPELTQYLVWLEYVIETVQEQIDTSKKDTKFAIIVESKPANIGVAV